MNQPRPLLGFRLRRRRCAFSLIEVSLAIGILAFGTVSILGLMPVALQSSRQSSYKISEIRMLDTVRATLLKEPFSQLASPQVFYFDVDGIPLAASDVDTPRHHFTITASHQSGMNLPQQQSNGRVITTALEIQEVTNTQPRMSSLHLPDNGY